MPLWNPYSGGLVIMTGNYDGNDATDRAVFHGLVVVPKLVVIFFPNGTEFYWIYAGADGILFVESSTQTRYAVRAMDITNFYVGNATSYQCSANLTGRNYRWSAIG